MIARPKDQPWVGGRVYDWQRHSFVLVVQIESAGEFLDQQAHRVIWRDRGSSSAEKCAMYGSSRQEPRHGAATHLTKE